MRAFNAFVCFGALFGGGREFVESAPVGCSVSDQVVGSPLAQDARVEAAAGLASAETWELFFSASFAVASRPASRAFGAMAVWDVVMHVNSRW